MGGYNQRLEPRLNSDMEVKDGEVATHAVASATSQDPTKGSVSSTGQIPLPPSSLRARSISCLVHPSGIGDAGLLLPSYRASKSRGRGVFTLRSPEEGPTLCPPTDVAGAVNPTKRPSRMVSEV